MGCVTSSPGGDGRGNGGGTTGVGNGRDRRTDGRNDNWNGHISSARNWSTSPMALTSEQLRRLVDEFWATRVEGDADMWRALRAAAEAESEELRDEIVNAAGLTPANKHHSLQNMYDEKGARYDLPLFVLRPPDNLDTPPVCAEFRHAAAAVQHMLEK